MTSPTSITHLRASGRYDRSTKAFTRTLADHLSQADLISLSEVGSRDRRRAIRSLLRDSPDPWRVYQPSPNAVRRLDPRAARTADLAGVDESAILWRSDLFRLEAARSLLLTTIPTPGRPNPFYAPAVVLSPRRSSTTRLAVTAAHLPASVQDNLNSRHPSRDQNVRAWLDAVPRWRKRFNRFAYANHATDRLINADWNVDLRLGYFQRYLAEQFPAFSPTFDLSDLPSRGTHGRRIIDVSLTTADHPAPARILPLTPASDHAAYKETLVLR